MSSNSETPAPLKSALFVDFDNIFLGLQDVYSRDAAQAFASDTARWLKWFEDGMPETDGEPRGPRRAILIRRCYLSPAAFGNYRSLFTRSAFTVIDCPPPTAARKNSADIYMVMDILDAMEHKTRFDEFIILSGDSDFLPVLVRLRAHDRRTTILTTVPGAVAYRAAADHVLSTEVFIEHALGISAERAGRTAATPIAPITSDISRTLDGIARRVYEVASTSGEIAATSLLPILKEFPEFTPRSNWLGFFSLRNLAGELVHRRPELRIVEGDPWRVVVSMTPRAETEQTASTPTKAVGLDKLRDRIAGYVSKLVAESPEPVNMARAASLVIRDIGPQVAESRWAGAGTFSNLLRSADGLGFEIRGTPEHLYDRSRHAPPALPAQRAEADHLPGTLGPFARKLAQVTGTPRLPSAEYAAVFEALAGELRQAAEDGTYSSAAVTKGVAEACIEQGLSVKSADVSFILKGIIFNAGHRFLNNPEADTALELARAFRDNVLALTNRAQFDLSEDEKRLLDDWLLSEVTEGEPAVEKE